MEICFATNNLGKLNEIIGITQGKFKILSLKDIGCLEELPENQLTISGNSHEKAEYIWKKFGVNCFADDTGLLVKALGREPGVYSARYAGPACNAEDNMDLLLEKLKMHKDRTAYFVTVITLVLDGVYHSFEGKVEGSILSERQGIKGFGYDPIFVPTGYDRSFANFTMEEKNQISHRGIAVRKLADFLLKLNHG